MPFLRAGTHVRWKASLGEQLRTAAIGKALGICRALPHASVRSRFRPWGGTRLLAASGSARQPTGAAKRRLASGISGERAGLAATDGPPRPHAGSGSDPERDGRELRPRLRARVRHAHHLRLGRLAPLRRRRAPHDLVRFGDDHLRQGEPRAVPDGREASGQTNVDLEARRLGAGAPARRRPCRVRRQADRARLGRAARPGQDLRHPRQGRHAVGCAVAAGRSGEGTVARARPRGRSAPGPVRDRPDRLSREQRGRPERRGLALASRRRSRAPSARATSCSRTSRSSRTRPPSPTRAGCGRRCC